jgi:DNA-directed RNA polymerase specialized sigma24 family protein
MALHDPRAGTVTAGAGPTPAGRIALLEESYGALALVAAFAGAEPAELEAVVREAAVAALRADGDRTALRRGLFRALLLRVAALEQAAGRSVAVEPEPDPEPAVPDELFEPVDSAWADWFVDSPPSLEPLLRSGDGRARARALAAAALAELPLGNRVVVVLRDVAGWPAGEVSALLGVDLELQRVALHGGRARVRRALEQAAAGGGGDG